MKKNKDQIQSEWLKKADLLTETLPFMKRYANKVIVVKFGGNAMGKKEYVNSFAKDIVLLQQVGMLPVVVHGGGPQIGEMLSKLQIKTEFINGLRITDEATIDVVEMVLSGVTNKAIVSSIANSGAKSVGISGKDGNLITAKRLIKVDDNSDSNVEKAIDLGYVGEPEKIDPQVIHALINEKMIPVIAPVGIGTDGGVISEDITKAKEIHKTNIRKARIPKLAELDIEYQRATETSANTSDIVAKKQALRDAPAASGISTASNTAELKAQWDTTILGTSPYS